MHLRKSLFLFFYPFKLEFISLTFEFIFKKNYVSFIVDDLLIN